jgi:hypothetical protein
VSTSKGRTRKAVRSAARQAAVRTLAAVPVGRWFEPRADDQPLRNVVVVTGPHRSGTTIMGRLLLHAPHSFLVHEPLNLDWGLAGVPHRFPYLTASDTAHPAAQVLRRFLRTGEGQWLGHGEPLRPDHQRMRTNRDNVRSLRPVGFTVIVKDPFLLLALGWANHALSMNPAVVTLRHPCAWVASLQRRSMHPRTALESFRAQEGFGDPVVNEILSRRAWEEADLVPAGAATWACLVRMLNVQLEAGARAEVVRMEDFALDPYSVLLRTYRRCGLGVPQNLEQIVEEYTGAHNIVTPDQPVLHVLRRNSSALVNAWRSRLGEDDQKVIREITEPVAARWYDTW